MLHIEHLPILVQTLALLLQLILLRCHFIELLFQSWILFLQVKYLVVQIVDLGRFLILTVHLLPDVLLLKLVQLIPQIIYKLFLLERILLILVQLSLVILGHLSTNLFVVL